ncbi:MAG: hypothetical protein K8I29_12880 [Alphaproteobacteria bacterium]|uniref:Uncharacterized protein n=1 Tax=Candidatus Nitrobium versatile TaxID=2884831 RepID=A0A953J9L6_9BACT|nr:hypothetical protein [Candidatus Nitrobium versatile]
MDNPEEQVDRHKGAKGRSIDERLRDNPILRARLEAIIAIAENEDGAIERADDAEQRAIEELQKLGNELMHARASRQQERKSEEQQRQGDPSVRRHGKKKSTGTQALEKSR